MAIQSFVGEQAATEAGVAILFAFCFALFSFFLGRQTTSTGERPATTPVLRSALMVYCTKFVISPPLFKLQVSHARSCHKLQVQVIACSEADFSVRLQPYDSKRVLCAVICGRCGWEYGSVSQCDLRHLYFEHHQ